MKENLKTLRVFRRRYIRNFEPFRMFNKHVSRCVTMLEKEGHTVQEKQYVDDGTSCVIFYK